MVILMKVVYTLLLASMITITVGLTVGPFPGLTLGPIPGPLHLSNDPKDLAAASKDFGRMGEAKPAAVSKPSSAREVAEVVRAGVQRGFTVSARGHGHSINGQVQAVDEGVVVEMGRRAGLGGPRGPKVNVEGKYVDVWGGELWVDVLRCTLKYGLAPRSWTDYLYLTVGGTLSNGGISGQAYNHGPQISNVYQLEVVTGQGEIKTCSNEENAELFYAVLGGLGQFGIITSARIALEPAPQKVRWIRVAYSNFTTFTKDQEYLISLHEKEAREKFDYVEGFVVVKSEGLISNWRSTLCSPKNSLEISSLDVNNINGGVSYCLEVTKNYFDSSAHSIDQEVDALLKKLDFIPSSIFKTDVTYVDFLDRVHAGELKLRAKGLWDVPHPWLNLLVPKSRIDEFDKGVFKGILGNKKSSGPLLVYPINKSKWDNRTSFVTPNEDVFYAVSLLRSALENSSDETQSLKYLIEENRKILKFCENAKIGIKQYLPHYTTQREWMNHFGDKWDHFYKMKMGFDPKHILATGQRIFRPILNTNDRIALR